MPDHTPVLSNVRRHAGIAGQLAVSADVAYPDASWDAAPDTRDVRPDGSCPSCGHSSLPAAVMPGRTRLCAHCGERFAA